MVLLCTLYMYGAVMYICIYGALFHSEGTTGLIVQPDTNSPSSKPMECNDKV